MILADKIMTLRKKAGWSQEELAARLNISRQSVSKWEGAQSIPDMDKVVQMSRLFGVTTDFLLKDELEIEEHTQSEPMDEPPLRRVTMEEASAYLALRRAAAPKMALATFLCIISPVALLMLAAMSEVSRFGISENAASGIGLCGLLVLVAIGAALFLTCSAKVRDFAFLEEEPFETEYGVSGMVKERMQDFAGTYSRLNITGTVLCILSAVPLFVSMCMETVDVVYVAAVCLLLIIAGIGCVAFTYGGTIHASMERLLEEGDYTRQQKSRRGVKGAISTIYWLLVTAIFMWYTFGPSGNGQARYSWFIWAIAGVLYAAVMLVVNLIQRSREH